VTMRLISLLDLFYFNGRGTLLFATTLISLAVQTVILSVTVWCIVPGAWLKLIAVAWIIICMASDVQMESLQWAFCSSNYLASATTITSLYLLAKRGEHFRSYLIAVASAIIAFMSSGSGLLVWPLGLIVVWKRGLTTSKVGLWCVIGIFAIAFYFVGYRSPPGHASPLVV
jgi:hypothetical protein